VICILVHFNAVVAQCLAADFGAFQKHWSWLGQEEQGLDLTVDLVHFGHCYAKLAADVLEQNLGWQNRILFNALASRSLDIFNHPQPSSTNSNLPYLAALQAQEAWFGGIKALTAGKGKMPGFVRFCWFCASSQAWWNLCWWHMQQTVLWIFQ